ncbi:MAG: substrate-binding domain-containing protein [Acidobacteria bacterium]|nr:substrate-binding domain-containing protein [Acidobacteriota bacterium]
MKHILGSAAFLIFLCLGVCRVGAAQNETANNGVIRLAIVNTPEYSGLIDFLVEDFEKNTELRVEATSSSDVYKRARDGKADIVISHYGKEDVEKFVLDGYGTWPRMVFSNQAAIMGPASDPAKIKGLSSAAAAFSHIAEAKAPFIVNSIAGIKYLEALLWASAGNPTKGAWYFDAGIEKADVVRMAEEKQAYFLWGAYPFLRHKNSLGSKLEILVSADPVLQKVMAAIVVNPNKIRSVNSTGAEAFVEYLLKPETQAKIASFRSYGMDAQLWWPAGHDN